MSWEQSFVNCKCLCVVGKVSGVARDFGGDVVQSPPQTDARSPSLPRLGGSQLPFPCLSNPAPPPRRPHTDTPGSQGGCQQCGRTDTKDVQRGGLGHFHTLSVSLCVRNNRVSAHRCGPGALPRPLPSAPRGSQPRPELALPVHRGLKTPLQTERCLHLALCSVLFSVTLILGVSASRTLCPVLQDWEGAAAELRAPRRPHPGPKDPAPCAALQFPLHSPCPRGPPSTPVVRREYWRTLRRLWTLPRLPLPGERHC